MPIIQPRTASARGLDHRPVLAVVASLFFAIAMMIGLAPTAAAADEVSTYDAKVEVAPDGMVRVNATVNFDQGAPQSFTQKFALRQEIVDQREYVFDVTDLKATADGKSVGTVDADKSAATLTVKAPGAKKVEISYAVKGAAVKAHGQTQVRWDVLQGLSLPVGQVNAQLGLPGQFADFKCVAGPPGTDQSCALAEGAPHEGRPSMSDGPRGVGEIVGMRLTFPGEVVAANETVDEQWTVGRAFAGTGVPLIVALAVLLVAALALFALHRRAGRDAHPSGEPTRIAEFTPVGEGLVEFRPTGEVLPGQVGTVVDERVDPIDVTATIIDLAVRGHLLIVELPRRSEFAPADWRFERRDGGIGDLRPYEQTLLDALAPLEGDPVLASQIGPRISGNIPQVQSELYDEMVQQGWYERRPDSTRNVWGQAAIIVLILGVVLTGVLAAFTHFGLTGLAVVLAGLGLAFVGQEMPARTPKGASLLAGLGQLRDQLHTEPTDRMPKSKEYQELSEVLPYAIVLGGAERWLEALVAADDDPGVADPYDLSWYHGPDTWHLRDLPDSLQNFIVTVSGNLFAR